MYSLMRLILVASLAVVLIGCGGSQPPVEMNDQVMEQVKQEDAAVKDAESSL
jgi:hypothetical protein